MGSYCRFIQIGDFRFINPFESAILRILNKNHVASRYVYCTQCTMYTQI